MADTGGSGPQDKSEQVPSTTAPVEIRSEAAVPETATETNTQPNPSTATEVGNTPDAPTQQSDQATGLQQPPENPPPKLPKVKAVAEDPHPKPAPAAQPSPQHEQPAKVEPAPVTAPTPTKTKEPRKARQQKSALEDDYESDPCDDDEEDDKGLLDNTIALFDKTRTGTQQVTIETAETTKHLVKEGLPTFATYMKKSFLKQFVSNIGPGFTVALVNVPLSISLGIAAGASPTMGCVTAFWAGITAALCGGSDYNIVGPTGALSGILFEAGARWGDPDVHGHILPILSIMTGIICLFVFFTKLDKLAQFVPSSTMQGFTIGVAVIIVLNQLNFALGLPGGCPPSLSEGRRMDSNQTPCIPKHEKFLDTVNENLSHPDLIQWPALIMFLAFFSTQLTMKYVYGKIPWAVPLAFIGVLLGGISGMNENGLAGYRMQTLNTRYPGLKMSLVQPLDINPIRLLQDRADSSHLWELFNTALSISMVVVLETLISARIADTMTKTHFNQRQEVLGISLANIVSGVCGGIPATAALARTALNIKSGATARLSSILNAVITAILSVALMPLFKFLPLPVVASLLANVAYGMLEWKELGHIWHLDKRQFAQMIFVALLVVCVEATLGIMVGTMISVFAFANKVSRGHALCTIWEGDEVLAHFDADYCIEDIPLECIRPPKKTKHSTATLALQDRVFGGRSTEAGADIQMLQVSGPEEVQIKVDDPSAEPNGSNGATDEKQGAALVLEYKIVGRLNFVTAETHSKRLRIIEEPTLVIVINFQQVNDVDIDGIFQLEVLMKELEAHGKIVYLAGLRSRARQMMRKTHLFKEMMANKRILETDYLRSLSNFVTPKSAVAVAADAAFKEDIKRILAMGDDDD